MAKVEDNASYMVLQFSSEVVTFSNKFLAYMRMMGKADMKEVSSSFIFSGFYSSVHIVTVLAFIYY